MICQAAAALRILASAAAPNAQNKVEHAGQDCHAGQPGGAAPAAEIELRNTREDYD